MLDIEFVRENVEKVKQGAKNKGVDVNIDRLLDVDKKRRAAIQAAEKAKAKQNALSKKLADPKNREDKSVMEEASKAKQAADEATARLMPLEEEFHGLLVQVPNLPTDDTPVGTSEEENQVVDSWGDKPKFDFEPKNHWEIAELQDWIDKERAAKVTGARFAYIKGELAELQMAIVKWVFDELTNEKVVAEIVKTAKVDLPSSPLTPVLPPLMISTEAFSAMDRLEPQEERYKIDGDDLWLQGSAEHVLGAMHIGEIIDEADLPLRYLGYASSFRREAGTYGKDMEGIIRMHQFDKLEMEVISTPDNGLNEHIFSIAIQEFLMQQLRLPYQKLLKCTADIGKPNARGVDLNAWLPGQGQYRETHTADFMTDYQARRLKTRVRRSDGSLELVHTIDATVLALGRTMVAIIENYQTKEGKVKVPEVLKNYLNNRGEIGQ